MSAAQTRAVLTGFRVQCGRCDGAVTFMDGDDAKSMWADPEVPSRYYCFLPCRLCGRWIPAESVRGKRGTKKCGTWCTEGYGKSCTCECAGANHGSDLALRPGDLWMLK